MEVFLRLATEADMPLVMAWRNIAEVRQGIYTQGYAKPHTLTWEEPSKWWHGKNKDWREFIICVLDDDWRLREVGTVTLGQLDHWCPEVGILIGEPKLWGQGIGKRALQCAIHYLAKRGYTKTHTTILKSNERSIRLFESVGYKRVGEGRPGEWAYELSI